MSTNNVSLGELYKKWVFARSSQLPATEKEIDKNALEILKLRYFIDLPDGQKESNFSQLCRRVARVIAAGEYKDNLSDEELEYILNIENSIYNDMMSHRFLFNSPALFSAGVGISSNKSLSKYLYKTLTPGNYEEIRDTYEKIYKNYSKNQMMFACFTLEVPDSIEGIFDSVKNAAIISKYGGGVGANFGHLREKGALIAGGCGGQASGPISFMQNWNTMGSTVVQGGKRRAALMGMLNIHHPDIEEFISCKEVDGSLSYFNISVAIDDKFMQAVKNDDVYDLKSPASGRIVKTVKARDLWNKICTNAHKNGDPGLFFIDIVNRDNLLKNDEKYYIETTNPCGEQPLPNDSSCNLGSINLAEFVTDDGTFNYKEFKDQILRSIYYLDLVIDVTNYPLKKIEKNTKDIRPVGLGIMGLADACIMLGIKYGSKEFEDFTLNIAKTLAEYSLIATAAIATMKGPYPHFDDEKGERNYLTRIIKDYDITLDHIKYIVENVIPNSDLPTSFKNALINIYNDQDYIINEQFVIELFKSIFSVEKGNNGLRNSRRLSIAPTGTISLLLNTSSGIEPNFSYTWTREVTVSTTEKQQLTYHHRLYNEENEEQGLLIKAHDLTPLQHVKAVSIFAPYIDSAISKTVNMPNESTVDDVKKIYEYCFDNGIKGVTIYRDGSRSEQPIKKVEQNKQNNNNINVSKVKTRPKFMQGVTTKCDSPYGSIYITANFDDDGKMFETFISAGKSGSVSKSITEALSRVISLALRSGVDIKDLIDTMSNISGSEIWVYDSLDGTEIIVKSIPDAASKMLRDLNNYYKLLISGNNKNIIQDSQEKVELIPEKFGHYRNWCPECNAQMIQASGCSMCPSCGYSDCK